MMNIIVLSKHSPHINDNNTATCCSKDKIKTIIRYPKLKLSFYSNTQFTLLDEVHLTPNTLYRREREPLIKDSGHKFSFGYSKDNDCALSDPNIAAKQFSVYYDSSTCKFVAVDNISGTGLFVKVTDKLIINHDMIVSFCADHMYLQVIDGKVCGEAKRLILSFCRA
jgi:hypothetical protein